MIDANNRCARYTIDGRAYRMEELTARQFQELKALGKRVGWKDTDAGAVLDMDMATWAAVLNIVLIADDGAPVALSEATVGALKLTLTLELQNDFLALNPPLQGLLTTWLALTLKSLVSAAGSAAGTAPNSGSTSPAGPAGEI